MCLSKKLLVFSGDLKKPFQTIRKEDFSEYSKVANARGEISSFRKLIIIPSSLQRVFILKDLDIILSRSACFDCLLFFESLTNHCGVGLPVLVPVFGLFGFQCSE